MGKRRIVLLLGSIVLLLALAACGGSEEPLTADTAARENAWENVLEDMGLTPAQGLFELSATGSAPELEVTLAVPPDGEMLTFGDGLYGALAYTYADGAWKRVDTAEIRTLIAPSLSPGESATVQLPVMDANAYRVLVPVEFQAVWTDVA